MLGWYVRLIPQPTANVLNPPDRHGQDQTLPLPTCRLGDELAWRGAHVVGTKQQLGKLLWTDALKAPTVAVRSALAPHDVSGSRSRDSRSDSTAWQCGDRVDQSLPANTLWKPGGNNFT